jgi:amidase
MKSLIYQTAGRLAKAIQKKEVTSEEVVQAHLAHIKKHNEKLNAIVILTAEEALKRAKEADRAFAKERIWGPLHGVPITIKEAFDVAGLKTTINFKQLKNNLAKRDAPVVARLKNAGAVILGKTNVPELLGGYQTDGHIYGRSNNPYNTDYTPGGSTGGGAAAVAAGFSPLELGSDFGGSIRIPSHFCGLYGLKPTENTVPMKGHVPPYPKARGGVVHMNTFGLLARAVEDIKLAFDIINGPDYRDVKVAPIQWKKPSGKTLSEYALAWSDTFGHFEAGKETRSLLQELAGKISSQGGNISKKNPPDFDFEKAWELWVKIWGYVMGQDIILPLGIIKGLKLNFARYARIIKKREELIAQLQAFFDDYDFCL